MAETLKQVIPHGSINAVAKELDISRITVQHVLNGNTKEVSPTTTKTVKEALIAKTENDILQKKAVLKAEKRALGI
jgi:1,4-dihydroxy-2-naphthoyl-CoA synthase